MQRSLSPDRISRGASRIVQFVSVLTLLVLCTTAAMGQGTVQASSGQGSGAALVALTGHVPAAALAHAQLTGGLPPNAPLSLAITLPLRNQAELTGLLTRIYDPNDPEYGHFLTPAEFTDRFGPTVDDYNAVMEFARARGLTITQTWQSRTLVNVSGPASVVEAAFGVRMMQYRALDGRIFHSPRTEPVVPVALASRIAGIAGLNDAVVWRSHCRKVEDGYLAAHAVNPHGSGPNGGMAPFDIRTAYNLNASSMAELFGAGQTLGLLELDGYQSSDITAYVTKFGLQKPPLQNVLVDGVSALPSGGDGQNEVTLDIDMMVALAGQASSILVYEGMNSSSGIVDLLHRMAQDNTAKVISTSWGADEGVESSVLDSENTIFQQMAVQGQTVCAATGDLGAYDNGATLSVDDPSSQPFVLGVGGTELFQNFNYTYNYETAWGSSQLPNPAGGGGGISTHWPLPSYQDGYGQSQSKRNTPDVSLNSAEGVAYAVSINGVWDQFYGTSAAAPLWAAYLALVNEKRSSNGLGLIGFANPALYRIAAGDHYANDFHDIRDGSTNLYYAALTGYDNATGLGSFNGGNLLPDLVLAPPAIPSGLIATAGNGQVALTWSASVGATSYHVKRSLLSNGPFALLASPTTTSYTNTGLTNGTIYYYVVSAVNQVGESGNSAKASALPFAPSLSSIVVSPAAAFVLKGQSQQYTAIGKDQNGNLVSPQPAFAWSVSGGGTISGTGLFTAANDIGGPFTITATSGTISGTATITVFTAANPLMDFNGDGKADLVLQNAVGSQIAFWYLNGPVLLSGKYTSAPPPSGWNLVSEGDFNGDGKPDLVLQNSSSSQIALWYLNEATVTGGAYVSSAPGPGWRVVGSGDFNYDGKRDLIIQNTSTNQVGVWYLNGPALIGGAYVSTIPPSGFRVAGAADFNGDGKLDLVLQNPSTDQVAIWYLNGVTVTGGGYAAPAPPTGWNVGAVGDFNADGKADIVLQNATSNQVALWYMNGLTRTGGAYVSVTPASGWKVAGPR